MEDLQMDAMAFDDIGGNLYGVTLFGKVFVCKAVPQGPLTCATVVNNSNLRALHGIAVDPNVG